ncbi:PilT protein domain protein [Caldithrix abyssi DSM 13497]|uniref:PilT protein domain protein n=1 Tax=Caldithrix abyssi DSM 13497 TaxID=880073 RepID=H1XS64_CALAY|nr:type II toxin-antitoxin system VapC family toxin [Caldithrix abyssi]APF20165.1 hypothetical protein Cabys_3419 [Caldithrix abyssi DSM 13497]EHO40228.1 PilT protein domain protein [Caldithrix abyssi DSM 13497]
MNGNRYLIDTNIAIYLLAGDERIADILDQNQIFLSFISELELLSFKKLSEKEEEIIKGFLDDVIIIDINKRIKDFVIDLRKKRRIKLPDAIIVATGKFLNIPLITADQQLKSISETQIVLYTT